jgi:hypothetical protein
MNDPRYSASPAVPPSASNPSVLPASLAMGMAGMIIGASGASAANLRRLKNGEIDGRQATKNVMYDAAGAAVATAAATAAVRLIGVSGVVAVAGMFAAATATRYLYDGAIQPASAPAAAPQPATSEPVAAKKAAPKRPAAKSGKQPSGGQTGSGKEE